MDDRREGRADLGAEIPKLGDRGAGVHPQELAGVVGDEGRAPCQTLEENDAEGVEVGATIDRSRQHSGLFGGGVDEGADRLVADRRLLVAMGEAEVDQPRCALGVEEDVPRLEIAVDDVVAVDDR